MPFAHILSLATARHPKPLVHLLKALLAQVPRRSVPRCPQSPGPTPMSAPDSDLLPPLYSLDFLRCLFTEVEPTWNWVRSVHWARSAEDCLGVTAPVVLLALAGRASRRPSVCPFGAGATDTPALPLLALVFTLLPRRCGSRKFSFEAHNAPASGG